MSYLTDHIAQLAKELNKRRPAESRRDAEMWALDTLTTLIDTAEAERSRLVASLRRGDKPASWAAIGLAMGTTKQAAQQRYGSSPSRDGHADPAQMTIDDVHRKEQR